MVLDEKLLQEFPVNAAVPQGSILVLSLYLNYDFKDICSAMQFNSKQSKRKLLHFFYLEWITNDFQINTVYLDLLFKAHYQSNIQLKLIIRQLNENSNFKVIEILTEQLRIQNSFKHPR